ncbi:ABC transporter family substrate-binding protein [Luteococcus sp. Sow4_B9]|uniref:ABC transporter family substrate-binding protein n=1 Tax=Luteococcus sp. Sow4_B9 TaxID=3438792 RepID=UPI003F97B9D4
MRKPASAVALLAVGALALSACGAPTSSTGGNTTSNEGPALSAMNEKPREELKEGGTVRFAISFLPPDWNTSSIDGNGVDNDTISEYTQPVNFLYEDDASIKENKPFLESYDVQEPKDGKGQVVTLHLNPEAKWNSGRTIDWTDYEATWKANNGSNPEFKPATTDGFSEIVSVAKGEKETDVVVTFKAAYPDWSAVLSSVQPKEGVATPELYNKGWTTYNPDWASGPFIFDKLDKAQKMVTFKRNPKWWGNPALLDSVSFRQLETPADVNAFANNEIDVVETMINATAVNTAKKRSDADIRAAGSRQWRHFTFNTKSGHLADINVRQAIVKATNREAITKSDLVGLPVNPSELMLGNHFFMPGQEGYEDNSGDFKYDVEAAKKQLDEAGWKLPEGKTIREKDGKPLVVKYTMLTGIPTSENEGKLLQKDLAAVGIDLKFVNIAPDDMSKNLRAHSFEILAFTWQGTQYPMNNVRQIYGAKTAGSKEPSESNYAQLVDPEIEKLIPQIDTEPDKAKRAELVNQVDKIIWEQVHTLPIYRRVGYTAAPKNLANIGAATFKELPKEDIGYVK